MTEIQTERVDLTSFSQLVQDLIGGAVRRHTFNPWEMELLLDFQTCRVRKSGRAELLRRYLKAVQLHFTADSSGPLRLAQFVESEQQQRYSSCRSKPATAGAAAN